MRDSEIDCWAGLYADVAGVKIRITISDSRTLQIDSASDSAEYFFFDRVGHGARVVGRSGRPLLIPFVG